MTLLEMSAEYAERAAALRSRITAHYYDKEAHR